MRISKNKSVRKSYKKGKSSKMASKKLKEAVKSVITKTMETKTINVPVSPGGSVNSINVPYGALSGIQYLAQDVFRQPQGTGNSTAINGTNRVGDKIKGVGFLMDYYFSIPNFYNVGTASFYLPYVKLRITVFKSSFGSPLLSTPLLYDTNFLPTNTSTLQPINWDEGYIKDVLFDKVYIIRNNLSSQSGGAVGVNIPQSGNMLHFKKYIKYDQIIKYTDNNTSSPNSTDKPIYIAIAAELDDANSGVVPSGTKIVFSTGYTRAWFKDV